MNSETRRVKHDAAAAAAAVIIDVSIHEVRGGLRPNLSINQDF